jgi:hypothetical protein
MAFVEYISNIKIKRRKDMNNLNWEWITVIIVASIAVVYLPLIFCSKKSNKKKERREVE